MALGNTVDLVGTLGRDPELRFTPGGMAVAQFSIAVNRRKQNRQTQEWEETTSWFDVVAYGTLAENVSESLSRGSRVIVQGRLEQRSWETQDGDKRSKIEVIADDIGPSLRWATVEVTRNERRSEGGQSGGYSRPAQNQPSYGGYDPLDDEEPFALDAFDGFDRFGVL